MPNSQRLSIIFLIAASLNFTYAAPGQENTKIEERTFDFQAGGRIQVIGDAGFIRVESWDKNEIHLRYTKRVWDSSRRSAERRLEDLQVEISDQPGQLTIRQVPGFDERDFRFFDIFDPDRWGHSRHASRIDFELKVPRQCHLILESDEGDIIVRQIEGEVKVDSDEGNIDLENLSAGEVSAETDEGEIDCRNLQLDDYQLQLASDEGTLRASDVAARGIWAETDEGDMVLLRLNAGGGKINSDEGDVEADFMRFDEGSWSITTDEGDVEIFVPANADAEISFESDKGNIRSDFNLNRISDDEDGERLTGRLGEGRARLEIYTDEGDIRLRRR
ncbi:MAG: DUF4097 domain-containing protein [candidate division KSB1 bacterium]|nr:DUF4097 domain-containing protein [candidate division KSB1 bacterium]MDZ7368616.1 DUF4097 domain-containing protein [candidate division KSB1 bacterium]MDZ7406348.1 DUF4097 domain-containing protein [candidate division KSB1 bacterium]